jgi:hypothetical protein
MMSCAGDGVFEAIVLARELNRLWCSIQTIIDAQSEQSVTIRWDISYGCIASPETKGWGDSSAKLFQIDARSICDGDNSGCDSSSLGRSIRATAQIRFCERTRQGMGRSTT